MGCLEIRQQSQQQSQSWLTLLDGPLQAILLPVAPAGVCSRAAGIAETVLHHLDPVTGAIIVLDRTRSLGDVNETWAGMLDELVVEELEAELVASLDGVGGGVSGRGALVATQVIAVHDLAGEGRVVGVVVLASIGILSTDVGAIDDETVEDVMGFSERRQQGGDVDGLHIWR